MVVASTEGRGLGTPLALPKRGAGPWWSAMEKDGTGGRSQGPHGLVRLRCGKIEGRPGMTSSGARGRSKRVRGQEPRVFWLGEPASAEGILRRRVSALETWIRLTQNADAAVEASLERREPLSALLERVLVALGDALGARRVWAEVLEDPRVVLARAPGGSLKLCPSTDRADDSRAVRFTRELSACGRHLGRVEALVPEPLEEAEREDRAALLEAWCEVLDDHLALVAFGREKHEASRAISRALSDPLLGRGLDGGLRALAQLVGFEDLVLVYRAAEGEGQIECRWLHRSQGLTGPLEDRSSDPELATAAELLLGGGGHPFLASLDLRSSLDESLRLGVCPPRAVARLIVGRKRGVLGPFERDLVEVFADCLRQRLVDFSREHAQLSASFSPEVVARLLREPGYRERYLAPREAEVAILFADIASFTRLSEEVLRTPARIGRLVDAWSQVVVRAIWKSGGVFDKMVGDCVIGLWGPPFFETSPEERCRGALRAATAIRELTRALPRDPELPELACLAGEIGVATGLHFTLALVGLFGPNDDYTGFSSGMNAAARLQGVARRDEVLCMEPFVRTLGMSERFGPVETARVKNVRVPLQFRRLRERGLAESGP